MNDINRILLLMLFTTYVATSTCFAQVNPADFGVKFDGSNSSTNAENFQAAIDNANSSGQHILMPPGKIALSNPITIPSGMKISGSGVLATVMEWASSYTGVGITGTNFSVENLTIKTVRSLAEVAIRCEGGSFNASFVQINTHWDLGMDLIGCSSSTIKNCRILSRGESKAGVHISQTSNNITILDSHFRNGQSGILIEGNPSDLTFKNFSCTAMGYGIRFNPTSIAQNIFMNGADISGCAISSVLLHNVHNAELRNLYGVLRNYDGSTKEGTFHVSGNSENILLQNLISNNNNENAASSGILIENGNNISISHFSSANTTYPITVKAAPNNVKINGSIRRDMGTGTVLYNVEDASKVTIADYTFYETYSGNIPN